MPFVPIVPFPVNVVRLFVIVRLMLREATEFVFPAVSEMLPAVTVITAGPPPERVAVNVAVYELPDPEKLLIVPKVAVMSLAENVVTDSVSVNVMVDVALLAGVSEVGLEEIVTDGAVVSIVAVVDATADRFPAVSTV